VSENKQDKATFIWFDEASSISPEMWDGLPDSSGMINQESIDEVAKYQPSWHRESLAEACKRVREKKE